MSMDVQELLAQVEENGVQTLTEAEYLYLRDRDLLTNHVDLRQREVVVNPGDVNSLQSLGRSDGNTHGDTYAKVLEKGGVQTSFEGRSIAVPDEDAVGPGTPQEAELEEINSRDQALAARRAGFDDPDEPNDQADQDAEASEDLPYSEWPKPELQAEARERGLDDTGTKRALVARLEEHDAQVEASEGDDGEASEGGDTPE